MQHLHLIARFFRPLAVAGLTATAVQAATLADYQFSSNLSPTSTDNLVTATAFGGTGTARSSSQYAYQYPQPGNSGFMEFTLTADDGLKVDLSTLSFAYYFPQTTGTTVNVTATFSLQYSLDGFATAGVAVNSPQASYTSTSGANDTSIVIGDFSSASYALSSIPDVESVSFRIILANDGSLNTAGYRYAIDNVIVDGAVLTSTIPEPTTYAFMVGFAALGLVISRRRFHVRGY